MNPEANLATVIPLVDPIADMISPRELDLRRTIPSKSSSMAGYLSG
jgi:hypothetical protein